MEPREIEELKQLVSPNLRSGTTLLWNSSGLTSKAKVSEFLLFFMKNSTEVEVDSLRTQERKRHYADLRKRTKQRRYVRRQKRQAVGENALLFANQMAEEALSRVNYGNVKYIHSTRQMETKLNAASSALHPVILYFSAASCRKCHSIDPLFRKLAKQCQKIDFLEVSIDQASDVASRWNISSVPTLVFRRGGKEVDKLIDAYKDAVTNKIAEWTLATDMKCRE